MSKKVVVAMSGGVDSSVTAAFLKEKGYECIGMHMRLWIDPKLPCGGGGRRNTCCSLNSLRDAQNAAEKIGIPFHAIDVGKEFKKHVVDYFLDTYKVGQTPNPCVACNRFIKFGALLERARELGADALATGHYARIVKSVTPRHSKGPVLSLSKGGGKSELFAARDKEKDQSYFLAYLTQKQLGCAIFPLGNFLKSEVYKLAEKFGLKTFSRPSRSSAKQLMPPPQSGGATFKKESQDICFFPEDTPVEFLKRHLDEKFLKSGPIVTVDGRDIGKHKGLPFYTIGQRHGLGIGGVAGESEDGGWYVVQIDRAKNTLVVGRKKYLLRKSFECADLSFIAGKAPVRGTKIEVRVRYRAKPVSALLKIERGRGFVECSEALGAVAPGQTAVFYKKEKVLGCGIIEG